MSEDHEVTDASVRYVPEATEKEGDGGWLVAESARARARNAKLPACYKPVVTAPITNSAALHDEVAR